MKGSREGRVVMGGKDVINVGVGMPSKKEYHCRGVSLREMSSRVDKREVLRLRDGRWNSIKDIIVFLLNNGGVGLKSPQATRKFKLI